MKGKEAEALCRKYLLPHLPGFAARKDLLYCVPIQDLLQAFCFEPSATDRQGFYFWVFVQPLYVPHKHISFSFGTRLGFGWEVIKGNESELAARLLECIRKEGMTWLESLLTPADFARNIISKDSINPKNLHVLRAIGYSHALIGDFQSALETLQRLCMAPNIPGPSDPEWQHTFFKEVYLFRDLLLSDPLAAQESLKSWRAETLKSLHLSTD
jgi:hypothetical protein